MNDPFINHMLLHLTDEEGKFLRTLLRENEAVSKQDKYLGIITEIVDTLEKDGDFAQTVQAIREELGSDVERYTSLEWHDNGDGHPDWKRQVLFVFKSRYVVYNIENFENDDWSQADKWAYLDKLEDSHE